jgi:Tat protein translocase TatB subunit
MFGLGMQEIIVIGVLALLLLGPKKLPELAQTVGKFMRDFQRAADDVKREISTPVNDLKAEMRAQAGLDTIDTPRGPDPTAAAYGLTNDAPAADPAKVAAAPATPEADAPPPDAPTDPSRHAG